MVDSAKKRHPAFGKLVDDWFVRTMQKSNAEVGRALGMEDGEMVRRYRNGEAMPEGDRLENLAALMRMDPADLKFAGKRKPKRGVDMLPVADVSPDEAIMLDSYRKLPTTAQRAVTSYVADLLERFAPADPENPYGHGKKKV